MATKVNAAFNTAFGEAVSIHSVIMQNKLIIAKKTNFNANKEQDTFLLTNNPLVESDELFNQDDFHEALIAYQTLISSQRCIMQEDLRRYNLENVIDSSGQKENGKERYEIDRLNNGHWAILATCLWFYRQINTDKQLEKVNSALDQLNNLYGHSDNSDFFMTI